MIDPAKLQALIAARDWPKAEALLKRAASAKGAPPQMAYNLAKVLEAQGKALAQRRRWLKSALASDPAYARAWFELGRLEIEAEAYAAALGAFEKAAALEPADGEAWRHIARTALRLGAWAKVQAAAGHLAGDAEARILAWRAATEEGAAPPEALKALLSDPATKQSALAVMTRTAKGRIPRILPAQRAT